MKRIIPLLFFIFFHFCHGSPSPIPNNQTDSEIDWKNINATELYNLDAPRFAELNATSLSWIPPPSLSGMLPYQMLFVPGNSTVGLSADQISNITNLETIKAMDQEKISHITLNAMKGFSAQQIAKLSPYGCQGINQVFFSGITVQSYGGLTNTCLAVVPSSSFSSINPNGLVMINPSSLSTLAISQLIEFPVVAVNSFTADQLGNLTSRLGMSFVSLYSIEKWNPNVDIAQQFVSKVGNNLIALMDFSMFNTNTTWIELAMMKNTMYNLTSNFVNQVNPITLRGLRSELASKLTRGAISNVTSAQAQNILPAAFVGFSIPQLKAFKSSSFGNLYSLDYFLLTSEALSQLPDDQIRAIPAEIFKNCKFSATVRDSKRNTVLLGEAQANYNACIENNQNSNSKLSGGQIAGIVIGTIIFAAIIIAAAVWFTLRRIKRSHYDNIEDKNIPDIPPE